MHSSVLRHAAVRAVAPPPPPCSPIQHGLAAVPRILTCAEADTTFACLPREATGVMFLARGMHGMITRRLASSVRVLAEMTFRRMLEKQFGSFYRG